MPLLLKILGRQTVGFLQPLTVKSQRSHAILGEKARPSIEKASLGHTQPIQGEMGPYVSLSHILQGQQVDPLKGKFVHKTTNLVAFIFLKKIDLK